jgi:galactokinase
MQVGAVRLDALYPGRAGRQRARAEGLVAWLGDAYPEGRGPIRLFSAPGRTEILGNHTDHQGGRVIAAAIAQDTLFAVRPNGSNRVRLRSEGMAPIELTLDQLEPVAGEENTTAGLLRGVIAGCRRHGLLVEGFDACVTSEVPMGLGLSSSAAFAVGLSRALAGLFLASKLSLLDCARIAQGAENEHFGKPCGLMDQLACSLGGSHFIDFKVPEQPSVRAVPLSQQLTGYALVLTNTGGSHAELNAEYTALEEEMTEVARALGAPRLAEVGRGAFFAALATLRQHLPERALLRAYHFFPENERVLAAEAALGCGDVQRFLALVIESGESSFMYLQNCYAPGSVEGQQLALGLLLSAELLRGKGAWRVHGGGFAGTTLAIVPKAEVLAYQRAMDAVFGAGAARPQELREHGAVEVALP